MEDEKVAAALAELSTEMKHQTQMLEEIKEEAKEVKGEVDSLKQSRSRFRGALVGLGLIGGGGAAGHTDIWTKLFG